MVVIADRWAVVEFLLCGSPGAGLCPKTPGVIRPGQFIDDNHSQDLEAALREPEPRFEEPDGAGTVNDKRNLAFYRGGTLQLTTSSKFRPGHPTPEIFDPYPDYNSEPWRKIWMGDFQACRGAHGEDLSRTSREDMVTAYRGKQSNFPHPMFGSHKEIGLDPNVCFDRYSRYGLYGYDDHNWKLDVPGFQRPKFTNWDEVNWGELQSECYERNANRYSPNKVDQKYGRHVFTTTPAEPPKPMSGSSSLQQYKPRSAVLLRLLEEVVWNRSDREHLRSFITELSLHSGGEYQVFFLLCVQDESLPIEDSEEAIQQVKDRVVPPEFHNMTLLFSERLLAQWYPKIKEHRAMWQYMQPIQVFSKLYPEFDYIWPMEFDARPIGHLYHFLEQAIQFAKKQPRKHLWERNAYFYTPGAHGTWKQFSEMVSKTMDGKDGVWGPVPIKGKNSIGGVQPIGPQPPVDSPQKDDYEWGTGEEADLITFLPIFDPMRTSWTMPWAVYNLPKDVPRRASVLTQWRISKRLVDVMHEALTNEGMAYASEMSAPSFALHHGLKAVHVPHPIYMDGQWTPKEIAKYYNQGPPERVNGEWDSIWSWNHLMDHVMYRVSYMFASQTGEDLYRRWMGYEVDKQQEAEVGNHTDAQGRVWFEGGEVNEQHYGRLCYPTVMLHPVKNPELQKGRYLPVPNTRC
ncbi:hypothetical protein N7512_002745 [Penicillium capsulatum]|nr:hypothetical protein N7512_002745 [Penicillium capsulatum]